MPRVLHTDDAGTLRALDYERDILGALDWSVFGYTERTAFTPDDRDRMRTIFAQVDMKDHDGRLTLPYSQRDAEEGRSAELDFSFMTRQLVDVIPNPWHAARILEETLDALRERGIKEERIAANRLFLLDAMTHDLRSQVDRAAETLFRKKLESGDIVFRLVSSGDPELNWQLAETINLAITEGDRVLISKMALRSTARSSNASTRGSSTRSSGMWRCISTTPTRCSGGTGWWRNRTITFKAGNATKCIRTSWRASHRPIMASLSPSSKRKERI